MLDSLGFKRPFDLAGSGECGSRGNFSLFDLPIKLLDPRVGFSSSGLHAPLGQIAGPNYRSDDARGSGEHYDHHPRMSFDEFDGCSHSHAVLPFFDLR